MKTPPDHPATGTDGSGAEPSDRPILEAVRRLWLAQDPMPAELGARVRFALDLSGVERELATACADLQLRAAARGALPARTVTFECGALNVAIMINQVGDRRRLDGWVAPERPLMIELRQGASRLYTRSDDAGRFVFDGVAAGPAELSVRPEPDGDAQRPVVVTQVIDL